MHFEWHFGNILLQDVGATKATLAEIARAVTDDWNAINKVPSFDALSDIGVRRMWEAYDDVFGGRCDYALWRQEYRPDFYTCIRRPTIELVKRGLDSHTIETWGTLSVCAGILGSNRLKHLSTSEVVELAALCSKAMLSLDLNSPQGTHYACTVIRLLLESALDRAWFEGNQGEEHTNVSIVNHFLDRIETLIKTLDPRWLPGRMVTIRGLYRRRAPPSKVSHTRAIASDTRAMLPFDQFDLAWCLANLFYRARGAVYAAVREHPNSPEVNALLQRAYFFAKSGWLSARWLRRVEEERIRANPNWKPKIPIDGLWCEEIKAMRHTVMAATDAGRHATAACMCHNLLWIIPEERNGRRWNWFNPNYFAFNVRQLGLEVAPQFEKRRPRMTKRFGKHVTPAITKVGSINHGSEQYVPVEMSQKQHSQPMQDTALAPVPNARCEGLPNLNLFRDLGILVYRAERGHFNNDPQTLRAAFHLCLKGKRLELAGRLLDTRQFFLSRSEVLDFAEAIASAGTLMPWAVDIKIHRIWQNILRRVWGSCGENSAPIEQELFIHETLLGRLLSTLRHSGSLNFAKKLYGQMSENQIAELYDDFGETRIRGAVATDVISLQRALQRLESAELGNPVAVSIVWLGENRWGLLAIPSAGRCIHKTIRIVGNLRKAKTIIQATPELYLGIPWSNGLVKLGENVLEAAITADPNAKWITLAIEPTLATLPWQSMLTPLSDNRHVISLVPSFTWVVLAQHQQHRYDLAALPIISSMEKLMAPHYKSGENDQKLEGISHEYEKLLAQVNRARTELATAKASMAVVVGHGAWNPESEMTSVLAPENPMGWDKWLEVSKRRLVFVHACSAGRFAHRFLGDIGGITSIALGQQCRLFAAPVAEVQPSTAATFQKHLTADTKQPVGMRYLQAIQDDPAVSLYNLWGFASEIVGNQETKTIIS